MGEQDTRGRPKVAPDGGWGWLVVLGVSVCNLSTRSLEPSFGLLFFDLLKKLNVETTGASVIMSTREATINFSGLFFGPLMRKYSFRKIAFYGSVLSALGLMLTASSTSMAHILVTYSVISGLGVGFVWCSTFVAINHYFSKNRGQAIGFSMAGTAVGFMLMPLAVQHLLEIYNFFWSILILGALALNGVVGASLLQPVKWHMKPAKDDPEVKETKEIDSNSNLPEEQTLLQVGPRIEVTGAVDTNADVEGQCQLGVREHQQIPRITSSSSIPTTAALRKRKESIISTISSVDFAGSTFHIPTGTEKEKGDDDMPSITTNHNRLKQQGELKSEVNGTKAITEDGPNKNGTQKDIIKRIGLWKRISNFMDFDLFKDHVYLNIIFGLSMFFVAELNFKVVVPFFMENLGYSKSETAFCLSMTAVSDTVARVALPPIFDRMHFRRRTLFVIFALLLGISRSVLAEQTEYVPFITTMAISGLFRGATLINCNLTISENCSLEKLPAAFGLYMVAKGIVLLALGPLVGVIRDVSGSYPLCIHSQTVLILLCVLAWGIEYFVYRGKSRDLTANVN